MRVETVKVKREGPRGYHVINKSDFDPKVHEVYAEKGSASGQPGNVESGLGRPKRDPLDHDGDGKKGGAKYSGEGGAKSADAPAGDDLASLKAEAKSLGISGGKNWTAESYKTAIADAKAAKA